MRRSLFAFILLFFASTLAMAQTVQGVRDHDGSWFVGAGVGLSIPHVNPNAFVESGANWPDDKYSATHVTTAPFISVSGGYLWFQQGSWFPLYSVAFVYTRAFSSSVKGKIEQFSLASMQNYTYRYDFSRHLLMVFGKIDLYRWHNLMPYFSLGVGTSINRVGDYTETAEPSITARVSPGFGLMTKAYFTYSVGIGIDYLLKHNLIVSVGYRYGFDGYVKTGSGVDTFAGLILENRLRSNNFLISIYYIYP